MSKKYIFLCAIGAIVLSSCQEDFDHHLQREAISYTQKHCPQNIETGITLDSATYDIPSRTYTQWHTLSGFLDSPEAHKASLDNLDKLKAQLVTTLRGDTKWETCKENGIDFAYAYRSASKGEQIFKITLTPKDYRR